MDSLIYVVAILGCSDAGVCAPVLREPVRYETKTQCLMAAQAHLPGYVDLDYPQVQARCEARGMQTADARGGRR